MMIIVVLLQDLAEDVERKGSRTLVNQSCRLDLFGQGKHHGSGDHELAIEALHLPH